MGGFDYMAAVALAVSCHSFMMGIVQLKELLKQRKLDWVTRIFDVNRQLITLGFSQPELFDILHDVPGADPRREQHYLQLWLNHAVQIFHTKERGFLEPELAASLEADFRDLLQQENMQRHWRLYRRFYSASFQTYVDTLAATGAEPS